MSYTESQKNASLKYAKEKLKRVPLDMKKEDYEKYKAYCDQNNISMRSFIISAMEKFMNQNA
ncbi:hypothetical protein [uncultured Robinsoniella sp.]|uniref:hypothetical protein n=1 Tax=uncultured Robinsoniella sp. TaxID=904190 RepID=UPI0029152BFF|nr:hypothetical protein [Clostridiales bacterium]